MVAAVVMNVPNVAAIFALVALKGIVSGALNKSGSLHIMKKQKISNPETIIGKLQRIIDGGCWAYVDYEYDRTSCRGCEDYCRCTQIINDRINSVKIAGIAREICVDESEIFSYCVNRILTHSELRSPDNWKLNILQGYYGEELDGARFTGEVPIALNNLLSNKNDSAEMVKIALTQEYGYLLPDLKDVIDFHIVGVALDDISIGQGEHYRRLDQKFVKQYNGFNMPLAVCLANRNGNHRLIDGYHRIAAARAEGSKVVKVILGYKE